MNTIPHDKRLEETKQRELLAISPAEAALMVSNQRLDFTYNGWDCWRNMFGEWGAILSRAGQQPIIITHCATREELISRIDA